MSTAVSAAPRRSTGPPTAPSGILILSLVSACGCNCVFCGLPDTRPHTVLPRETMLASLEGTPTEGPWQEVNITGGDPLVIPAARALFPDLLARRDRYAQLSVSSAGIPARRALSALGELAEHGPLDLYVSLDGVGEVHDRVRRRRGAFGEVETFLREARRFPGVRIALTCVINRLNLDHLDAVADYAESVSLPISYAIVSSSDHYISSEPRYDAVRLLPEQTELAVAFLDRRSSQRLDEDLRSVLRGGVRTLPCRLLHDGVLVTSDGAAAICGTSQRMVLASKVGGEDVAASWRDALHRRDQLLSAGAANVCRSCTSNCYAWRKSDGAPIP